MSENVAIRRYLRREADERVEHQREYPKMLRVVAYHLFEAILADPDARVDHLGNYEDALRESIEVPVSWQAVDVDFDVRRSLRAAAWVFLHHHGLGDIPVVIGTTPQTFDDSLKLSAVLRTDDRDRLPDVIAWLDRLESCAHPLKGKLFSLGKEGLSFLPPQQVGRDDLVLPPGLLDDLERRLAFLEAPADYPESLRRGAVVLAGPPGVGKTLIARWLSVRFRTTGLWVAPGALWAVGPGPIFDLARRLRPTLLVLEDLDLASGDRNGGNPLGDLLAQLDGFTERRDLAVVATTNRPEILDAALDPRSRPGRFDRLVRLGPPDAAGRRELLARLLPRSTVLAAEADTALEQLVAASDGHTGAQLTELVRELESRTLWTRRRGLDDSLGTLVYEVLDEAHATPDRISGFAVSA